MENCSKNSSLKILRVSHERPGEFIITYEERRHPDKSFQSWNLHRASVFYVETKRGLEPFFCVQERNECLWDSLKDVGKIVRQYYCLAWSCGIKSSISECNESAKLFNFQLRIV